jgi:hypothetical protein
MYWVYMVCKVDFEDQNRRKIMRLLSKSGERCRNLKTDWKKSVVILIMIANKM